MSVPGTPLESFPSRPFEVQELTDLAETDRFRATITERDRELLADEEGGNRRYQAISEIRSRINEELSTDVEVLKENHPELLEELREVV